MQQGQAAIATQPTDQGHASVESSTPPAPDSTGTLAMEEPKKCKPDGTLLSYDFLSIDYANWFELLDTADSYDIATNSLHIDLIVEFGEGQLH